METSIAETVPLKCCSSSESSKINQEEYEMEKVLEKIENSREISEEDKAQFNCSTLYAEVLKKVTNGNQIINKCLDESIFETSDNPNDPKYGITVNFEYESTSNCIQKAK